MYLARTLSHAQFPYLIISMYILTPSQFECRRTVWPWNWNFHTFGHNFLKILELNCFNCFRNLKNIKKLFYSKLLRKFQKITPNSIHGPKHNSNFHLSIFTLKTKTIFFNCSQFLWPNPLTLIEHGVLRWENLLNIERNILIGTDKNVK